MKITLTDQMCLEHFSTLPWSFISIDAIMKHCIAHGWQFSPQRVCARRSLSAFSGRGSWGRTRRASRAPAPLAVLLPLFEPATSSMIVFYRVNHFLDRQSWSCSFSVVPSASTSSWLVYNHLYSINNNNIIRIRISNSNFLCWLLGIN